MRKSIAILLAVLFLVSFTATAVNASHPVLKREFMTTGEVSGKSIDFPNAKNVEAENARWGPENSMLSKSVSAWFPGYWYWY